MAERIPAVGNGEHARPGRCHLAPAPGGLPNLTWHQTVNPFVWPQMWLARAPATAPEAGALPCNCIVIAKRMKAKAKSLRLLALWPATLFLLTSCSTTSEPSPAVGAAVVTYKKGVPGGVLVQTDKLTATVTAIDPANHTATLQGAGGKHFTVKVGREAVNFHQVRVGDQVTVTLTLKAVVTVKVTGKVDPLADGITNSLAGADRALAQIRGAGENLRTMLAPDSPVRNDLDLALEQLAAAGQSIASLADFLKQHPNALIAGRELPKNKP
jgi:hypothetical protein